MTHRTKPVTVDRDASTVSIRIPMKLKRKSGRREVVVSQGIGDSRPKNQRGIQPTLVTALARAHRWQELLDDGHYEGISDLARHFEVDPSYVGRILRLTLLAPDIVEAIVDGREPEGMTYRKLTQTLPLTWEEQRRRLGFQ